MARIGWSLFCRLAASLAEVDVLCGDRRLLEERLAFLERKTSEQDRCEYETVQRVRESVQAAETAAVEKNQVRILANCSVFVGVCVCVCVMFRYLYITWCLCVISECVRVCVCVGYCVSYAVLVCCTWVFWYL